MTCLTSEVVPLLLFWNLACRLPQKAPGLFYSRLRGHEEVREGGIMADGWHQLPDMRARGRGLLHPLPLLSQSMCSALGLFELNPYMLNSVFLLDPILAFIFLLCKMKVTMLSTCRWLIILKH